MSDCVCLVQVYGHERRPVSWMLFIARLGEVQTLFERHRFTLPG